MHQGIHQLLRRLRVLEGLDKIPEEGNTQADKFLRGRACGVGSRCCRNVLYVSGFRLRGYSGNFLFRIAFCDPSAA